MKKYIFLVMLICLISFTSAFFDDFNRANSDDLGLNWNKSWDAGTANTNASIFNNTLLIQDTSTNIIRVYPINETLDQKYERIRFYSVVEGCEVDLNTLGMEFLINNESLTGSTQMLKVRMNDTDVEVQNYGSLITGSNKTTITPDYLNKYEFVFNWTTFQVEFFINDVSIGKYTTKINATNFGQLQFSTDGGANVGNWTINDYYIGNESESTVQVTLNSPINGASLSSSSITFNASYLVSSQYNLTNYTYYIYNSTGIFNNTENGTITGTTNETSVSIGNFILGDYKWNVNFCYGNATYSSCSWAMSNSTFSWIPFSVLSSSFSSNIKETENQTLAINISTISSILQVSSILYYNGTPHVSDVSCSEGVCLIENSIDTPLIVSGSNRTFYWNISVFDGSTQYTFSTSTYYQNTTPINLVKCGGAYTTTSLNFTAYDERNLTRINPFVFDGFFRYWIGGGSVKKNYSLSNSTLNEVNICIDNNMDIDADINYIDANSNYVRRTYYYDNASITSTKQDVFLYLLNSSFSTSFILEVEDQKNTAVPNAYIYIQRFYPGEGIYRTVQIARTDDSGKSIGFYEIETIDYKHTIVSGGSVELETSPGKIVPESTPYTLNFKIGDAISIPWDYFEKDSRVTTNLWFNETTNMTYYSWIDTSGSVSLGRLVVYQRWANQSDTLICNISASFSSATLSCNVTGYTGEFVAYGYIAQSPESFWDSINFIIDSAVAVFGNTGIIIGFFIILTAGLIFIWNPTAMIISLNVATIFVNLIGFITFGATYIFAMIAVSIIIIIFMKS